MWAATYTTKGDLMNHTRQMTQSALLADLMTEPNYDISQRELNHNLGVDWEAPMRDLVQLNLVSTFFHHGERYFAIARG